MKSVSLKTIVALSFLPLFAFAGNGVEREVLVRAVSEVNAVCLANPAITEHDLDLVRIELDEIDQGQVDKTFIFSVSDSNWTVSVTKYAISNPAWSKYRTVAECGNF